MIANPFVRFLEKRVKIMRKHSSMMIIMGVLALIVLACYFFVAKVGGELISFLNHLPTLYAKLATDLQQVRSNLDGLISRLPKNLQNSLSGIGNSIGNSAGTFVRIMGEPTVKTLSDFAKNIPTVLIYTIMTILSSYFFIADREKILITFKKYIPQAVREHMNLIWNNLVYVVGGYFKAQFKIMLVVAIILLVGFSFLGISYAILLSILIALLDFLPFFGTGTVLIPWAVIKLLSSDYKMAVGLTVTYLISQLVRQIIQPKIVGDTIGLDPLSTLLFMFIGYRIDGVFGMIVAVPAGMILIILYRNGAFENLILSLRILVKDFNKFRKLK